MGWMDRDKPKPLTRAMRNKEQERLAGQAGAAGKAGGKVRRQAADKDKSPGWEVRLYNRYKTELQRAKKAGDKEAQKAAAAGMRQAQGLLNDAGLNVKGELKKAPGRKPSGGSSGKSCTCHVNPGKKHKSDCDLIS